MPNPYINILISARIFPVKRWNFPRRSEAVDATARFPYVLTVRRERRLADVRWDMETGASAAS